MDGDRRMLNAMHLADSKLRLMRPMVLVLFFSLLFIPQIVNADSGAISQSYQTTSANLTEGTLLSLTNSGSSIVEPANSNYDVKNLIGIAASKPLVELSNGNSDSVQVVVSGTTDALVSDMNGPIMVGDKITASPVSGIGMKATDSTEIAGVSQANLSDQQTVTKYFATKNGKSIAVKIGLLPIAVGVEYYSDTASQSALSSFLPPFLQSLANALTGKQVPPLRVLLGTIALLLGFVAVIVMLYVSIRSGIISIGRNPLAESALRRGIVDIIIAAIGVLIITMVVVYVVLNS